MEKLSLALLAVMPLALCSCFGSGSAGVQGKSFVYSSCVSETVKSGSSDAFYVAENPAGSTKDDVVNHVVKALYRHGTSTVSDEMYFSNHKYNGFSYMGEAKDAYAYNEYEFDEFNITSECYYVALDSDYTSLHFVKEGSSASDLLLLSDYTFLLGFDSSYSTKNDVDYSHTYKTSALDSSIKYDASNKKLTVTMDVTYYHKLGDVSGEEVITYTLEFKQK